MKFKPLTIYPAPELRREMSRVAEADHDRPLSKVAEMALRAFIVLWERDKWEAMKLADEFKDRKTT